MANVEYVLKAKDEASATVSNVLRQFQGIEGVLGKIQSVGAGAGTLGLVAGGLIGVASAAFSAASAMANTVEQLDRLVENTGISSERLQAMRQIVENNGGSFDEFEAVFARLNRAIADGSPLLKKLGITSRDTFTVFTQVAGALANISDPATRAQLSYDLLGKSSVKLIADMQALATQTDATREDMDQKGGLIGTDTAERARELDKQIDKLHNTWKGLATTFQSLVVPLVTPIVGFFDAILAGARNVTKAIGDDLIGALKDLAEVSDHAGHGPSVERLATRHRTGRLINGNFVVPSMNQYGISVTATRKRPQVPEEQVSDAEIRRRMQWAAQGGPQNNSWEIAADANKKYFESIAKSVELIQVPALRFTETAQRLRESMDLAERAMKAVHIATSQAELSVSYNIDRAISTIVRGSENIRNIFSQLMAGIAQDLAEVGLKLGIGLGLDLLGVVIGGPAGGFISGVGRNLTGADAMAPTGGDTYYISTLNAKDLIQEITAPSGQLRRANNRIRDVSMAAQR